MVTTGGFKASFLIQEEASLTLPSLEVVDAITIGKIATEIASARKLPIAIEVRISDWIVYHASLPGSNKENQSWIDRKARVVILKRHSTLFERVYSEELGLNWYQENNLSEELYAIHGGGLPLVTKGDVFKGTLLISGLPQIEDHQFGVEVLKTYLGIGGETR